jgi:regulator of protease activity HflC (stomatin/prohibitin superfamily)
VADAGQILAILIPVASILYAIITSLHIVRPTEKGLVERLGKYHRFVEGGVTLLFPLVDRIIKVNITERMAPVERQGTAFLVYMRSPLICGLD